VFRKGSILKIGCAKTRISRGYKLRVPSVFSSSERDAAYVIDGLQHNVGVKK
jgi:hypothetical protein